MKTEKFPATVLVGDLLRSYSLGIKTLYYQNTYDGKGDEEITDKQLNDEISELLALTEECETCSV